MLTFLPKKQWIQYFAKQADLNRTELASINQMFTYVQSFWYEKVGVDRFSVYGDHHRTNNAVESFHRSLNRKITVQHPGLWKFIGKILL
jgi:hypothetical protein